jgi:hypothetical protein
VPGYDSQVVSEGRHGGDSFFTRALVLCQNIKFFGRGSGCRSGGPARALKRGVVSPEGVSSRRARRSITRGGVQPSSEVESRRYSIVPLERSEVLPEGCQGRPFWWAAEDAGAVGSCYRAVIVLGVIYDL